MPPVNIHVIGIDPGKTTGWAWVTIPRASLYEGAPSEIVGWEYDELHGDEDKQVDDLARIIREVQGLDYKVGPAVAVEDFDLGGTRSTDKDDVLSPVRIAAKLRYAQHRKLLGDASLVMMTRGLTKGTVTDERLRRWGLWIPGSDHCRDAMRCAIGLLRCAGVSEDFRDACWNSDMLLI